MLAGHRRRTATASRSRFVSTWSPFSGLAAFGRSQPTLGEAMCVCESFEQRTAGSTYRRIRTAHAFCWLWIDGSLSRAGGGQGARRSLRGCPTSNFGPICTDSHRKERRGGVFCHSETNDGKHHDAVSFDADAGPGARGQVIRPGRDCLQAAGQEAVPVELRQSLAALARSRRRARGGGNRPRRACGQPDVEPCMASGGLFRRAGLRERPPHAQPPAASG